MKPLMRLQYNAPTILTYALISLGALGLAELTSGASNLWLFSVYRAPLSDPLMYLRLFTHAIGHANLNHYINNFMIIMLIGPMLEERYGKKWLVTMMVVTAFVTGVLHMIVSSGAKLGASGIVFMLILLSSFTNLQRGRIPITLVVVLIIFIGREVASALVADATNNIAYLTHIVGGICGAMFGFLANRQALTEQFR